MAGRRGQQMRQNKFAFCLSNFPFAFDYFLLSLGNLIDAQQLTKFGGNMGKGKGKGTSRKAREERESDKEKSESKN